MNLRLQDFLGILPGLFVLSNAATGGRALGMRNCDLSFASLGACAWTRGLVALVLFDCLFVCWLVGWLVGWLVVLSSLLFFWRGGG